MRRFTSAEHAVLPCGRASESGRSYPVWIRLVVVFAFVVALVGLPRGVVAEDAVAVTTDAVNLRAEPTTDADIVDELQPGLRLEVWWGPIEGGWYEVYDPTTGRQGWVLGAYLSIGGNAPISTEGGDNGEATATWSEPERWIDVDRGGAVVTLYSGGDAIASYGAALGWDTSADGFYATANGSYTIYDKVAGLTWTEWGQVFVRDWVGFDPSRLNGFHTWSLDANGNLIAGGDGPTGGCVALEPWAADQLFAFAEIGMRVEVHY